MWTSKTEGEGLSCQGKVWHGIEPECCILSSVHVSSRPLWMVMQLVLFLRSMAGCIRYDTIQLSLNLFQLSHGYQTVICWHLRKFPVWLEEKCINSSPDFSSRPVVRSNMLCPVSWCPMWSNIFLMPAVMSGGKSQTVQVDCRYVVAQYGQPVANENTTGNNFLWHYLMKNIHVYFLLHFMPVDPFKYYTLNL